MPWISEIAKSNTVTVSKLPTVSISKDWADWSYWAFSGLLVAVGSLQVWLLWRTLSGMRRQADLMEGQLKEMQEAGERAARQLALTERELEIAHRAYLSPTTPDAALDGETRVPIENYGKIAARVTSARIEQVQLGKDGKEIFRKERVDAGSRSVPPGKAGDYAIFFKDQPFTAETLASIISIVVDYDAGFGKTDTLLVVFSRHPNGGWTRGNTVSGSATKGQENPS